ncbi:uncharacterized protein LOC100183060 isoform X2 [Ciona intestinalis]
MESSYNVLRCCSSLRTIRTFVMITTILVSVAADLGLSQNLTNSSDEYTDWNITRCFQNHTLDLVFLVESRILTQNETKHSAKHFILDVVRTLTSDGQNTRISLLSYNRKVEVEFGFVENISENDITRALDDVSAKDQTEISLLRRALRHTKNVFFGMRKRQGTRRRDTPFALVVLTDRQSRDPPSSPAANIRRKGGRILVVGFGEAHSNQLGSMASMPLYDNLFVFQSSSDLQASGPNTIASALCNQVNNNLVASNHEGLRKSSENSLSRQRIDVFRVESTPNSLTLHWRPLEPPASFYTLAIVPRHEGRAYERPGNLTTTILGLRPSTIYRISIRPWHGNVAGQQTIIVHNTAPLPPTNVTMNVIKADACDYQRMLQVRVVGFKVLRINKHFQLQLKYEAQPAILIPQVHCISGFQISMLVVNWYRDSELNSYRITVSPNIPSLSYLGRKSSQQIFVNPTAGVNYTVQITSQAPRFLTSEPVVSSFVANPMPPSQLSVKEINDSSFSLTWRSPNTGVYDSFRIILVSSFERRVIDFVPTNSTQPNAFYTYVLSRIPPNTLYHIKVFSMSLGATSISSVNSTYFRRATPLYGNMDQNLRESIILSTSEGIFSYPHVGEQTTINQSSIQVVLRAPGGVVNAVHHRSYDRGQERDNRSNTSGWKQVVVWIERQTSEIKLTSFENQITTVTLVRGLLQPVGLAVDFYGGNIYWTDNGSKSIGVASTDIKSISNGSYRVNRRLVSGSDIYIPISITLDAIGRHIFWSDLVGSIDKCRMDGTDRTTLVKDSFLRPYGLTYCATSDRLYWVDSVRNVLEVIRTDGRERHIILRSPATTSLGPSFFTVVGNRFFWTNSEKIVAAGSFEVRAGKSSQVQFPLNITDISLMPGITGINAFDISSYEQAALLSTDQLSFPCVSKFCDEVCIPVTLQHAVCVGQCFPWEVLCPNSTSICVNTNLLCDGINDCIDGTDESLPECDSMRNAQNCTTGTSNSSVQTFQCSNSTKCVPYSRVCDGRIDCRDGSDEVDCPMQSQNCSFEGKLCLWTQDSDDDFDWTLWHRQTLSNGTGPFLDHTMLRTNSSYLYAEATTQNHEDKARLSSVWLARPVCLKLYYHMRGASVGNLSLYIREYESGNLTKKWEKSGNQGIYWNIARVSINYHSLYQIIIEASRGIDYPGDIAIDDVEIKNGLCKVEHSCSFNTFDDLLCGYEQAEDWILWSGPSETYGTGPNPDVEYVEDVTEKPTTSPVEQIGPDWFYYDFMIEDDPGCNECNGTKLVRELPSYVGPKLAGIVLCNTTKYKIFLGSTLRSVFRNVADGAGSGEDHCELIGSSDLALEVGDHSHCRGLLGFTRHRWHEPLQLGPFGQERHLFYSPSYYKCNIYIPQSVIDMDPLHKARNIPNYYFLFDASRFPANHKAKFIIPISTSSDNQHIRNKTSSENQDPFSRWCLNFKYHMHGADVGSLSIAVNSNKVIWNADGDQGIEWKVGRITIPAPDIRYDLTFTAVATGGPLGDIALDDVFVEKVSCFLPHIYTCDFNTSLQVCSFVINTEVDHISLPKLYNLQPFDPIIVSERSQNSIVLTYTGNVTDYSSHPVIKSPILPALTSFYPAYCFNVEYRQRTDEGDIGVILRSTNSNRMMVLQHIMLSPLSKVRPWLIFQTQINSSIDAAWNDTFTLEFHGLRAAWVNKVTVETKPCDVNVCNNGIRCGNNLCVMSRQLCDGVNNCGDWSDEIGCTSHCGTVADVFTQSAVLIDAYVNIPPTNHQCVWRIHGRRDQHVLIEFGELPRGLYSGSYKVEVYNEFSDNGYRNESRVLSLNTFTSSYVINSTQVTIALDIETVYRTPAIWINVTLVGHDHCNFVCDNLICVMDNYACDGIVGCPDESDESFCTRISNEHGNKLLEIRRLNEDFSLLCGDDVTVEVADAVCQQLGYWRAETPLQFTSIPQSAVNSNIYRLIQNSTYIASQPYVHANVFLPMQDFQQNRLENHAKSAGSSMCPNRNLWVANCESYQCGVRPTTRTQQQSYRAVLRLLGGRESRRAEFPWLVSLQSDGDHICGGTIISERHILTAAHCFDEHDPLGFMVVTGANDLRPLDSEALSYPVHSAQIHRTYDQTAYIPDWDIAILEVERRFQFSQFASSACLPGNNIWFRPGKRCHVAGYGRRSENGLDPYLQYNIETPILTHNICNKGGYEGSITERMICAGYPSTGGIGICHGDSGGPLLCEANDNKWYLAGVVSWSIGCAERKKPDVFTNVQYFMDWINQHANLNISIPRHALPGECGGVFFNTSSGNFASPGWPSTYLSMYLRCNYRILGGPGQTIRVVFNVFATESNFDTLTIYNGGIHNANIIARLSGTNLQTNTYTVHNNSMELVFRTDGGIVNQGFLATYTITGVPVNVTGEILPVEILPAALSARNPTLLLVYGIYHPKPHMVGHRPSYIKTILLDDDSTVQYQLYYYENQGQWRLKQSGNSFQTDSYLYVNDSSMRPELIRTPWHQVDGSISTSIGFNIVPIAAATTTLEPPPIIRVIQLSTTPTANCVVEKRNLHGYISNSINSTDQQTCDILLQPNTNFSANPAPGSASSYFIILVYFFYSETGNTLKLYGNTDQQALYTLQGSFSNNTKRDGIWRSMLQNSGSGDGVTTGFESSSNSSSSQHSTYLTQQQPCLNSLSRFTTDSCSMDIYNIFIAVGLDPINTLLECSLLLRCTSVSWCDMRNMLMLLNTTRTTSNSLITAIGNFCDNPLWMPTVTAANEHSGSGETDGKIGQQINTSTVSYTKHVIVYEGENLRLVVSGNTSLVRYYITYHVVSNLNDSPFNLSLHNTTYLHNTATSRTKRSLVQLVQPLSMVGHSTLPTWQAIPTTRRLTTTTTTNLNNAIGSSTTLPPTTTNPRTTTTLPPTTTEQVAAFTNVASSCGGTAQQLDHIGARWVITSPNFPQNYPFMSQCEWRFTTIPGYQVVLEFTTLDLEGHEHCRFDWIKLYNTTNTTNNSPIIGLFCKKPEIMQSVLRQVSNSNMMKIVFNSDHIITKKGFRAVMSIRRIELPNEGFNSTPPLFACDFNTDRCNMTDDTLDTEFNWSRNKLGTASADTGPYYDDSHDGLGYYMYIETSTPQERGNRARIVTPLITARPDHPVCLRFSYDMFGETIGMLNVYAAISLTRNSSGTVVEPDRTVAVSHTEPLVLQYGTGVGTNNVNVSTSTQSQTFLLWTKSGQQRQTHDSPWMKSALTFFPFNSFQLIFEGIVGRNFQSDIAIDNIFVTEENCAETCNITTGHYQCLPPPNQSQGECILHEMVCDGKRDCLSGSDETSCLSTVRHLCNAEPALVSNTTKHRVCNNVDLCGLRSLAFTRIDDIICDGVYDCFSGIDESMCPQRDLNSGSEITEADTDCGHHDYIVEDVVPPFPNVSEPGKWPWLSGLYVKSPSQKTGPVSPGYTFLCSVVFIRQSWAVVPAHCLLNPSLYDTYDAPTTDPTPVENVTEIFTLAEFDQPVEVDIVVEESESETDFKYVVIAPLASGESPHPGREAWKVSKWIIHPLYGEEVTRNNSDTSTTTAAPDVDAGLHGDASRVNYDIALLKLEPDDGITSESVEDTDVYTDILNPPVGVDQYVAYDSNMGSSNMSMTTPLMPACLETDRTPSTSTRVRPSVQGGVFKLPPESERFSPDFSSILNTPAETGLPTKAKCYLVGHSPSPMHSTDDNSTDSHLVWRLRHFQSFVTTAETTSAYIFCITRRTSTERRICEDQLIHGVALGETSNTSTRLNPLIRSGYQGIRTGAFLNDQGLALFCQRHDGSWFLNGMYNWINLQRNFMKPDFRMAINTGLLVSQVNAKVGVSLGTDYFTLLTPALNEWIENTLGDACPGEFSCYPPDSMLHLCLPLERVCDGIIDCAMNSADEQGCPSGCLYDPNLDPYYNYYNELRNSNISVPTDVYNNFGGNSSSVFDDPSHGWMNGTSHDRHVIRFNQVDNTKVKSCHWIIKAPVGKVAVLVIPKMNSNPEHGGGTIHVISGNKKIQNVWSSGPNYFTSKPGQSVTFMMSPLQGKQYLSRIRTHQFEYYIEDIGVCSNQHRCGDGKCVSYHKLCNGDFDCTDLSDEINCPSGCGDQSVRIGSTQSHITSRNYPFPYKGSGDCLWIIMARSSPGGASLGNQITLQFKDFRTSYHEIIFIFDGVGRNKKINGIFGGNHSPFNVTIPSNQVTVMLRSNDGIAERRINAMFHITTSSLIN